MSNEFNIDPNVWYQISNDRFDPNSVSLRVGETHTAIYLYTTNLTSPLERWQIFPVSDGGGWNFRAQITGSGAYMSQCTQLTSTTASNDASVDDTDVCMALGSATDVQRRWILNSNGDGTFDIGLNSTNPLFQNYHLFENATNTIAFTDDTSQVGVKWSFQSIIQINDPAFSTGIVAAATTTARTSTTSSSATSSPAVTSSATHTQSPSSTSTTASSNTSGAATVSTTSKSSGLSSGAAAGIGIGVAVLVLALAAIAFWILRRQRRQARSRAQPQELQHNTAYATQENKPLYHDEIHHAPPAELHHQSLAELDHTPTPDRSHAGELPGATNSSGGRGY